MRIVFIGPPGVGKGTQSRRLIRAFSIPHLSTGDMLREATRRETALGKAARSYMESGQLVPDKIVLEIVQERLLQPDCQNGYLLDGFPRTPHQAEVLDDWLAGSGLRITAALELYVDRTELLRRLTGRGRHDDQPDMIKNRIQVYSDQTAPVLDYYRKQGLLYTIDGSGSEDEVFQRIMKVLQDPTPSAPASGS